MVRREGYWWPDHEEISWQQTFDDLAGLNIALAYVKNRKVCIQAGGNVGVWPIALTNPFESVITIEPDRENYDCLIRNVEERANGSKGVVYPIFGALGHENEWTSLSRQSGNCGGHFLQDGSDIPVYTIDGLPLAGCDLIVLDLEGMEPWALLGARKTIERFKPVIMVEDKWNSERYGVNRGWSNNFAGYRVAEHVGRHKDPILVPNA